MRIRFRIGPFTSGSSGTRLSSWRGGSGFSIPLSNKKATSYGKIKLGIFSFFFNDQHERRKFKENTTDNKERSSKGNFERAYEPWSREDDGKLVILFKYGKTVSELANIFGRTEGAIRSRISKHSLS